MFHKLLGVKIVLDPIYILSSLAFTSNALRGQIPKAAPPPAPKRASVPGNKPPVRSDASDASLKAARASNLRFDPKGEYVVFACGAGHDTRVRRLLPSVKRTRNALQAKKGSILSTKACIRHRSPLHSGQPLLVAIQAQSTAEISAPADSPGPRGALAARRRDDAAAAGAHVVRRLPARGRPAEGGARPTAARAGGTPSAGTAVPGSCNCAAD